MVPIFDLPKLTGAPIDASADPNGLRDAVSAHFAQQCGEWESRVHLCNNLETTPVEDASTNWLEDESSYLPEARLTVEAQPAWSKEAVIAIDECMAFSPWHGLAAHRLLGGVMWARNPTHMSSAKFRGQNNGCPMHEPRAAPRS